MGEILGALFAVLLALVGLPVVIHEMHASTVTQTAIATADQQRMWSNGVNAYVKANYQTIQAQAGPTNPYVITTSNVAVGGNNLDSGFTGVNPYGQTWTAEVTQPVNGTLRVLVYAYGGKAISDQVLGQVAGYLGGAGGMIPLNDSRAYPGGSSIAYGTRGGWRVSTSGFTNISGGHPASLFSYTNGAMDSEYLYRNYIPGQPQLNVMNTSLGMGGNDINNAATVNASVVKTASGGGVGVTVGQTQIYGDSQNTSIRQNGTLYVQNQAGTAAGSINAGSASVNDSVTVGGSVSVGGNSVVNGDSTVNGKETVAGDIKSGGRVISGGYIEVDGQAVAGNPCDSKQLGTDGTQILQCKDGIWSAMGGGITKSVLVTGDQICGNRSSWITNVTECPSGYRAVNAGWSETSFNNGGSATESNAGPDELYINDDGVSSLIAISGLQGRSCFVQKLTCVQ